MTSQACDIRSGKTASRRKTHRFIPLIIFFTFLLTLIPIYFPFSHKTLFLLSHIAYQQQPIQNAIGLKTHADPPPKPEYNQTRPNNDPDSEKKPKSQNPPPKATLTNNLDGRKPNNERESQGPIPAHRHVAVVKDSSITQENNTRIRRTNNGTDHPDREKIRLRAFKDDKKCDLFTGEWVPNPEGPYYTNGTCDAIQEHQNCMKFGRPDTGFLKWRWKPEECELPVFDPVQFLELVRGKSLAFVGDSVARNHMQSLICLLSRVAHPEDMSSKPTDENRLYTYKEYNFNISIISSPYLVRTEKTYLNDPTRPFNLFLDEFDEIWTSRIGTFDYMIISAGQWFFRPTYFYINRTLTSCLYCPESNVTHELNASFSYRRAFRTAFQAINTAPHFNGVAFLRTFAPSHFEGGPWDKGGDCVRTRPFKRNETRLEDYSREMYLIQLEELGIAQRGRKRNGGKLRLFDATKPMLLRPDGHPSKYGRFPVANQTFPNDCVHWCLPGPIDSWNDFLQALLRREVRDESAS